MPEADLLKIPESLIQKNVDNFEPQSPQQSAALRVVKGLIGHHAEVSSIHGLWLFGSYGTGKTHLQAALFNALPPEGKLWVPPNRTDIKYPLADVMLSDAMSQKKPLRIAIENAKAIFIDELTFTDMYPTTVQSIADFIQLAYIRGIPLFISANHSLEEVSTRIQGLAVHENRERDSNVVLDSKQLVSGEVAERIQSRLMEMVTPIEMLGRDFRELLARRAIAQYKAILKDEESTFQSP